MSERITSFLLFCVPRITTALGYEQVLRSGFLQRLDAPDFGVRLLHPTFPDTRTFPFWVEEGAAAAGRILVRQASLVGRFASPGRNRNLLLMTAPLRKKSALELQPEHDSKSHFLLGAPPAFEIGPSVQLNDPLAGFERRLYHECAPRQTGDSDRWLVAHSAETSTSVAKAPHGWVNPVVLRIELEGNVFGPVPANAADTDPRAVMQRELLSKFDIVALYPLWPADSDARLVAWEKLIGAQPQRARFNAIERLILGADARTEPRQLPLLSPLAAFFCLDQLGGQFAVHAHGSPLVTAGSQVTPPGIKGKHLSFSWWPPAGGLQPNATWLADYAERCWAEGRTLDAPAKSLDAPAKAQAGALHSGTTNRGLAPYLFVTGEAKARLQRPDHFEEPASRLSAARQRWEQTLLDEAALLLSSPQDPDDADELVVQRPDQHWDEVRWIRSCLPQVRRDPLLRDFFIQLFGDERLRGHALLGAVRRATRDPVKQGENWICEYNFEQLEETVGRDFVAPLSALRFEIPIHLAAASEEDARPTPARYFDLMRSLNDGGIGLLTGLLQSHRRETSERNRERLVLEPSAGWWNDWHLCLFGDPAELRLEFLASGLTLGVSSLGETPLGGSTTAAAIPSVMNFTRPAPREVTGSKG